LVQTEEKFIGKNKVAANERVAWFVINQQSQADGRKQVGVINDVNHSDKLISWNSQMEGTPAFFS